MTTIHSILQETWGYAHFRPLQEEIITTVMGGSDCLALLPTGGGKSLCFQVPALAKPGLCLVISPLIALMKDQVNNLRRKNITALAIYSGMTRKEVINNLSVASNSNCKFLYVSPERLETSLFKEFLPSLDINLIAVDEAHCISQWGYDFRPPYLRIAALREEIPDVPILALTASATGDVQNDICAKLDLHQPKIFRQSFSRPNLSYSSFEVSSKINKIIDILQKVEGSAIVYCKSRKRTKEIADLLHMHDIKSDYYHAGLSSEQRNAKQESWIKNETRVIVCTNAFGMGIDKPDVRVVVHADMPDCLENYYQEAGRAGRDQQNAYAVLLFAKKEIDEALDTVPLKFPPLPTIRLIYGSLMNHLQVASGTGEGMYFELDVNAFVKQFNLNMQQTLSVFKTLEYEQLLAFNEQVFISARLRVTASREILRSLEVDHPEFDEIIKSILRSYEGVIDNSVTIYERGLAARLKLNPDQLILKLQQLHAAALIEYTPQKDKPHVYLITNRIKAEDIQVDNITYTKRRNQFEQRLQKIIDFATNKLICKSLSIGRYFGDDTISDCGICDVCRNKKKQILGRKEFAEIHEAIVLLTRPDALSIADIVKRLEHHSRSQIMESIKFLESENVIIINEKGLIKAVS